MDEKLKVKSEWIISDFYNKLVIEVKLVRILIIKKGSEIKINKDLFVKKIKNVLFERWNYYIIFIGYNKNFWIGVFKIFMEEFESSKNDFKLVNYKKWKELVEFFNWIKNIKIVFEFYNNIKLVKKEVNISVLINDVDIK